MQRRSHFLGDGHEQVWRLHRRGQRSWQVPRGFESFGYVATKSAVNGTQAFLLADYKDIYDFVDTRGSKIAVNTAILNTVKQAVTDLVISGGGTDNYKGAHGISLWMPSDASDLNTYQDRYSKLSFNKATDWLSFLKAAN